LCPSLAANHRMLRNLCIGRSQVSLDM